MTLRPAVVLPAETPAERLLVLHEEAHRRCFIASSVNFHVQSRAPCRVGRPGGAGRGSTVNPADDLPAADTGATRLAEEVVRRHASPALLNHVRRTEVWARALAVTDGLDADLELLQVAALLHDLGLEEPFDSHRSPFERAGGAVAWVFAAGAGWPRARRTV